MNTEFNYCPECGERLNKDEKMYKLTVLRRIPFTGISFNFSKKNVHPVCFGCLEKYHGLVSKRYSIEISLL